MLFKTGAGVYSSDNQRIGTLHRVVMDPKRKDVSHIIVTEGILFTEDKVIPMEMVGAVEEDRIILQGSKENLDQLPDYKETHFIPHGEAVDDEMNALYWYPPADAWDPYSQASPAILYPPNLYTQTTERNIPDDSVAVSEGARAISADGENVGTIESLRTDKSNHVTHVVLTSGMLARERKLIPVNWLGAVTDDEVKLSVDAAVLERLPEYHPQA